MNYQWNSITDSPDKSSVKNVECDEQPADFGYASVSSEVESFEHDVISFPFLGDDLNSETSCIQPTTVENPVSSNSTNIQEYFDGVAYQIKLPLDFLSTCSSSPSSEKLDNMDNNLPSSSPTEASIDSTCYSSPSSEKLDNMDHKLPSSSPTEASIDSTCYSSPSSEKLDDMDNNLSSFSSTEASIDGESMEDEIIGSPSVGDNLGSSGPSSIGAQSVEDPYIEPPRADITQPMEMQDLQEFMSVQTMPLSTYTTPLSIQPDISGKTYIQIVEDPYIEPPRADITQPMEMQDLQKFMSVQTMPLSTYTTPLSIQPDISGKTYIQIVDYDKSSPNSSSSEEFIDVETVDEDDIDSSSVDSRTVKIPYIEPTIQPIETNDMQNFTSIDRSANQTELPIDCNDKLSLSMNSDASDKTSNENVEYNETSSDSSYTPASSDVESVGYERETLASSDVESVGHEIISPPSKEDNYDSSVTSVVTQNLNYLYVEPNTTGIVHLIELKVSSSVEPTDSISVEANVEPPSKNELQPTDMIEDKTEDAFSPKGTSKFENRDPTKWKYPISLGSDLYIIGPSCTVMTKSEYLSINWLNPFDFIAGNLLTTFFDRTYLATHAISNCKRPRKPIKTPVNPKIVADIIFIVTTNCKDATPKAIREALTKKCRAQAAAITNEKKKMLKEKERQTVKPY